eukprot:TRINITY_DN17590_c0_g1_i1.p1 TRINITY_DN17590_c0_g1~~TRINITY_DN17590_c0_g1_i1.p1  ORF type:complete len:218 (-),score=41.04 TRINITY_DN17590_c0_g1_i1:120-773(-)
MDATWQPASSPSPPSSAPLPQESRSAAMATCDAASRAQHRLQVLYAALACEHPSFESAGWPAFRSLLDRHMVENSRRPDADLLAVAARLMKQVGEATEAAVGAWIARFSGFLRATSGEGGEGRSREEDATATAFAELGGYCHLGVLSALLLQVQQELAGSDRPDLVVHMLGMVGRLWDVVDEASAGRPELRGMGSWPVDALMARVSELMDAAAAAAR